MKKKGIVLILSSLLILGACNGKTSNNLGNLDSLVFESGTIKYSESDLLNGITEITGNDLVKQIILEKVLIENYKVSDEEIDDKMNQIEKKYESSGGIDYQLAMSGMTREQLKRQLKTELAHEKALIEKNNVTEKVIKEEYEKIKEAYKTNHITVDTPERGEEIVKMIKSGKSFEDIKKLLESNETAEETLFIKTLTLPVIDKALFTMSTGQTFSIPNPETGKFHVITVISKEIQQFEELEEHVKGRLMYKGIKDFHEMFNYVSEKHKVKLSKKYKTLLEKKSDVVVPQTNVPKQ